MKKNSKSKLKKLFAGILSTAMVISTMAFTGFAADETIDESQSVKLTIHKYLYNDTTTTEGTGEATTNIPAGATALEGAEFSVWKIADIDQSATSNVIGIQYTNVTSADIETELASITNGQSATAAKNIYELVKNATANATEKTDSAGKIEFTTLDQGLYLVAETGVPDGITSASAPFLVSLPTTVTTTTNDTTTSKWLYDVHAYPKNSNSPSLTVYKYGITAGADDAVSQNRTALSGAKFYLQKQGADGTWQTVTQQVSSSEDDGNSEGTVGDDGDLGDKTNEASSANVVYETKSDGSITIDNLSTGAYRLVEYEAPNGYIVKSNTTYEFNVSASGAITGTSVQTDTDGNSSITVINERPTIEKSVLVKGGSSTNDDAWQDVADYSVGDDVTFKINVTIPANISDLTKYTVTDKFTASQFKVDENSFNYAYYDKAGNTITSTSGINLSATVDNTNGEWTLNLANTETATALADAGVSKIEITYTAELLSGAVTAGNGNTNTVELNFASQVFDLTDTENPTTPEDGKDPEIPDETITDSALVLTFGIQLDKLFDSKAVTDGSKTATFNLYRVATAGETGTTSIAGVNGSVVLVGTYTTDTNGQIILNTSQTGDNKKGFSNGTYYFVETVTEKGYNLLKEPVEVEVQVYYTLNEDGSITYYSDANKAQQITDTTTNVTVNNKSGFTFPLTGGRGTIVFTVVGILLMLAAVSVFFASRKRKTN